MVKKSASSLLVLGGIVGTIVGGSSTVGTAQAAFTLGLSAWWYTLGCSIGILLFAFFFFKYILVIKQLFLRLSHPNMDKAQQ